MSQCRTFEDLQTLGTEKIHEKTHISRDKVELLLTKSFGEIGQVQFRGCISILEREYGIDLSGIRLEYTEYWGEHAHTLPPKRYAILQPQNNGKEKWMIAGGVLIVLLLVGGYFLQGVLSNEPNAEVMTLDTPKVEPVVRTYEENNTTDMAESNITAESNATSGAVDANTTLQTRPLTMTKSGTVTIRPNYKVWVGMIDMASGAKTQLITNDPIVIDATRNWLIVLGHGRVEIETPEEKQVLKEKETVRFICENGLLKQLSLEEFIERNGGRNW
jgi:hypothetical protein